MSDNEDWRDQGVLLMGWMLVIAILVWGFSSWPRFFVLLSIFFLLWLIK